MSIHKLTAGDGYTYLTRQVAAFDVAERGHLGLADYYTAVGEAPGVWAGAGLAGLAGLGGLRPGDVVTEAHMRALFGEGRHPDADAIELAVIEAGGTVEEALAASALGRPFAVRDSVGDFRTECARRFAAINTSQGRAARAGVPDQLRARMRTQVAREMFAAAYGRPPADERELSGFVARASRQATTAVAGYDLTFSPVKSVSALWAVTPRAVSERIEAAHHAAIADTLTWLEQHAAYTRTGRNGIRQVDVTGLLAAAFTHRDSRSGDPDLHTHLVISNKVQTLDGRWLALDGRILFKATVAASERYNTRLEAELTARLGVRFAPRPDVDRGRRPVREIVGVDPRLIAAWSARRTAIEDRRAELAARFQADHGRVPTPVEAIRLAQQATLETRPPKHAHRTMADQRRVWRHQAIRVVGGARHLDRMIRAALTSIPAPEPPISRQWIATTARHTLQAVQASRASWQSWHVRAEAERRARTAGVRLPRLDEVVDSIVARALAESIPLVRAEPVTEPAPLRRRDGSAVYTVAGAALYTSPDIISAERQLIAAAGRRGGRAVPHHAVDQALRQAAATGTRLNPGQAHLVRELATSGARLQLVIAPAGSGKTTALQVLTQVWTQAGGTVIGLAPSAAAAAVLRTETGASTDTLAKLTHALTTGPVPDWVARIGPDTLVLIDEAGMAGTLDLARTVTHTLSRGGSVRLVGDDHQLSAVPAGGVLRDIADTAGAVTLTHLMRFHDPAEAAATLALRVGDPAAIGFYLDRGRVHVGDPDTATDQAYQAWAAGRSRGLDAVMLAPTRAMAASLNARARADRLTHTGPAGRETTLADGNRASLGDTVITRANRRDLTTGQSSEWVRNGERWTVTDVHHDGSLSVTGLHGSGTVRLPARYVAADVELGYASTIHTAQGITASTSRTILTGTESRHLLYTALTRGAASNHAYLAVTGTGDPHDIVKPHAVHPPTAGELLERILARDDTQRSATTHRRDLQAPESRLHAAVEQYLDALTVAAEQQDPRTAHDRAAVLRSELVRPDAIPAGPLPWLPAIPAGLATHPEWSPYLAAQAATISALASQVRQRADGRTQADASPWMQSLLDPEHDRLRADLAVWRAATATAETDRRPTGAPQRVDAAARYQRDLTRRIQAAIGIHHHASIEAPAAFAARVDPRITLDPYWPELVDHIAGLHLSGLDTTTLLTAAAGQGPLPDEHPAAAMWWRITQYIAPPPYSASPNVRDKQMVSAGTQPAETTPVVRWRDLAASIDPRLPGDPDYQRLASALDRAQHAGYDAVTELPRLVTVAPLPADRPAAALLHRLFIAVPTSLSRSQQPEPDTPDVHPPMTDGIAHQRERSPRRAR
jgi:conjugative relaxase-like TrwC/TraI family protein